jgi:pimeloyl-ACP methyl ester carboxylesterase
MNRRLPLLVLLLAGCFSLDSFLFEPTTLDHDYLQPEDIDSAAWHVRGLIPPSLVEPVTLLPATGNTVYGFFIRSWVDALKPTILYSHGRSENINRYWGRVELLWEAGYNVFIYDYEGYGRSTGTPSADACYADARAALEYCLSRTDVDSSAIAYYGWSLGSFMACHLAVDVRAPCALILETPLASTSALAKEGAVLAIPGSFVAGADFDNETRIQRLDTTHVLIIYGRRDETAVASRHAEVLLDLAHSAGTRVQSLAVDSAGHGDIPEVLGYEAYRRTISDFIGGVP